VTPWREVFRDDAILVVDKPSGLASQPDPGGGDDLYTLLRRRERYVGLHHRLDRPASGLVLLALDPDVNAALAEAFREHRIDRSYLAVLAGDAVGVGTTRTWDAPIDGQTARTDVEVLGAASGLLAVRCALHTGRTHQIRRHAAMAGTPIVGDRRYGGEVGGWWPRLALHAYRLRFRHPRDGREIAVEAAVPGDLAVLWRRAGGAG
jgi:23S rRNA pseudouridine1911/1915/1917 synthase